MKNLWNHTHKWKKAKFSHSKWSKNGGISNGHFYRKYLASEKECQSCPLRPRCISVVNAKHKQLSVPIDSLSHQMVEKTDTERGRRIYPQRLAIAEPVFTNIRINKRLDRFTLRGKIKLNIQ
jgi:hypothetical protein